MLLDIIINGCYLSFFQAAILVISTLTKKSLTASVMPAYAIRLRSATKVDLSSEL